MRLEFRARTVSGGPCDLCNRYGWGDEIDRVILQVDKVQKENNSSRIRCRLPHWVSTVLEPVSNFAWLQQLHSTPSLAMHLNEIN